MGGSPVQGRWSTGVWGQNYSYRVEENLQRTSHNHGHTHTQAAALSSELLPGVIVL